MGRTLASDLTFALKASNVNRTQLPESLMIRTDQAWYTALAPYVERRDLAVQLTRPVNHRATGLVAEIPSLFMRFPLWRGPAFVDDFGKKSAAMVDLEGEHVFAEIAVLRLLQREGWDGRWVNTYGGHGQIWKLLTDWADLPRKEQRTQPITDGPARELLSRIAASTSEGGFTGCWDIYAWKGIERVFIECKRQSPRYRDRVKPEQEEWVRAALSLEHPQLTPASFCFVQWDYHFVTAFES
jgi:hypothetical protein